MKVIGIILIAVGLIDLVGSYAEFDLWGEFIGVQLPDILWQYSAYIEMIAGYVLYSMAGKGSEEAVAE